MFLVHVYCMHSYKYVHALSPKSGRLNGYYEVAHHIYIYYINSCLQGRGSGGLLAGRLSSTRQFKVHHPETSSCRYQLILRSSHQTILQDNIAKQVSAPIVGVDGWDCCSSAAIPSPMDVIESNGPLMLLICKRLQFTNWHNQQGSVSSTYSYFLYTMEICHNI